MEIKSVDDARRCGISFIHQEISNVPSMNIAENFSWDTSQNEAGHGGL